MTALPPALARWSTLLALFPDDLAPVLGNLVARLDTLFGASESLASPRGEVDGYRGIARRGPYERLLTTEWLLHDELPDEFMRRAVSGEHAFLERAHRHEGPHEHTLVLFDAGPQQLGAPRLVQMAALIVFAQRVAHRKGVLAWGVLQDETTLVHRTVDVPGVTALLNARSRRAFSNEDVARWRAVADLTPGCDAWLVASSRQAKTAVQARMSLLGLDEALEPTPTTSVIARVHARSSALNARGAAPSQLLALPDAKTAVRLLREPFRTQVVASAPTDGTPRIDPSRGLFYSHCGRLLFACAEGGALLTLGVPNSPRAKLGPPGVFTPPPGHLVVAAGRTLKKSQTLVVTAGPSGLFVHVLSKRGSSAIRTTAYDRPDAFSFEPSTALGPLGVVGLHRVCFVDARGALVDLTGVDQTEGGGANYTPVNAVASLRLKESFVYLTLEGGDPTLTTVSEQGTTRADLTALTRIRTFTASERMTLGADGDTAVVARAFSNSEFAVWRRGSVNVLVAPNGSTVVGVLATGVGAAQTALLVVDATRTKVEALERSRADGPPATGSPVVAVAVSGVGYGVAVLHASGELRLSSRGAEGWRLLRSIHPPGPSTDGPISGAS